MALPPDPRPNPRRAAAAAPPAQLELDLSSFGRKVGPVGTKVDPAPVAAPPPNAATIPISQFGAKVKPGAGVLGDAGQLSPLESRKATEALLAEKEASLAQFTPEYLANRERARAVENERRASIGLGPIAPHGDEDVRALVAEVAELQRTLKGDGGGKAMVTQAPWRNAVDVATRSFLQAGPDAIKFVGLGAEALDFYGRAFNYGLTEANRQDQTLAREGGDPGANMLTRAADEVTAEIEKAFPGDAGRAKDFSTLLAGGAGSFASFLIGGATLAKAGRLAGISPRVARNVGVGGLGASQQGVAQFEDAEQFGAKSSQKYLSLLAGAGLGASELLPIDRFFMRLNTRTGGRVAAMLASSGAQGLEEFVQEVGQSIGSDVIAKEIAAYDASRVVGDGALEAGFVGLILGGAMGAGGGLVSREAPPQPQPQAQPGAGPQAQPGAGQSSAEDINEFLRRARASAPPPPPPGAQPGAQAQDEPPPAWAAGPDSARGPGKETYDWLRAAGLTNRQINAMNQNDLIRAATEAYRAKAAGTGGATGPGAQPGPDPAAARAAEDDLLRGMGWQDDEIADMSDEERAELLDQARSAGAQPRPKEPPTSGQEEPPRAAAPGAVPPRPAQEQPQGQRPALGQARPAEAAAEAPPPAEARPVTVPPAGPSPVATVPPAVPTAQFGQKVGKPAPAPAPAAEDVSDVFADILEELAPEAEAAAPAEPAMPRGERPRPFVPPEFVRAEAGRRPEPEPEDDNVVASEEVQTDDGETIVQSITRRGPWDFNDTYPAPNYDRLDEIYRQTGDDIFDDGEGGRRGVEQIAAVIEETLNELVIRDLDIKFAMMKIRRIRAGQEKIGRRTPEQAIKPLEASIAQDREAIRGTIAALQDPWDAPAVAGIVREARKRSNQQWAQTDKGVDRLPKEERDDDTVPRPPSGTPTDRGPQPDAGGVPPRDSGAGQPEGEDAGGVGVVRPASPRAPKGPKNARPRGPVDLLGFLAGNGGLRASPELDAFDIRRLRPGLIRANGKTLDQAREAAAEAGYLGNNADEDVASTDVGDLLDAIDRNLRGDKVYSYKDEPEIAGDRNRRNLAAERRDAERAIDQTIQEFDLDIDDDVRRKAIKHLMDRGGEPDDALEAAVMATDEAELTPAQRKKARAKIPGWDDEIAPSAWPVSGEPGRVFGLEGDAGSVQQPEEQGVSKLRGEGDRGLPAVGRLRDVSKGRGSEAGAEPDSRAEEQRPGVRADQLPVGDAGDAVEKPAIVSTANAGQRDDDDGRVESETRPVEERGEDADRPGVVRQGGADVDEKLKGPMAAAAGGADADGWPGPRGSAEAAEGGAPGGADGEAGGGEGEEGGGKVERPKPYEPIYPTETMRGGESETKPADSAESATGVEAIRDHFLSGEGFPNILAARKFAKNAGITGGPKEFDEAIEEAVVRAAHATVARGARHTAFEQLVDLYGRQPKLAVRTGQSVADQAYSTPVPLAYFVGALVDLEHAETVYEPTAGNGALLIGKVKDSDIRVNEIDEARRKVLRRSGPKMIITGHDASTWNPGEKTVDLVIGNPPFGAVREGGKPRTWEFGKFRTRSVDHAIVLESLKAMKDNGRAVFIVGGVRGDEAARKAGYSAEGKRLFYWNLFQGYNVTHMFTVNGDLYAKQGAAWPVDVIVIEGRGKATRKLPAIDVPAVLDTWDDVAKELSNARSRNADDARTGGEQDEGAPRGDAEGREDAGDGRGPSPAGSGGPVVGRKPRGGDDPGGVRAGDRDGEPADAGASGAPGDDVEAGGDRGSGGPSDVPPVSDFDDLLDELAPEETPAPKTGIPSDPEVAADVAALIQKLPDGYSPSAEFRSGTWWVRVDGPRGYGVEANRTPDIVAYHIREARKHARDAGASTAPPKPKAEPKPRRTKGGKKAAAEGIREGAKGLADIAAGLDALFSTKNKVGSGPSFDEETWAKAKPFFAAAMQHFKNAAKNAREAMRLLMKALIDDFNFTRDKLLAMRPYIERFVAEMTKPPPERKPRTPRDRTANFAGQVAYEPRSKAAVSFEALMPGNLRDALNEALDRLEADVGPIDDFVEKELGYSAAEIDEYFSAEQVDALGLGIYHAKKGDAVVLGDQTGIGKGRVVAGMIRWAMRNKQFPVFVTEKPDLYGDIYRDLRDIGMPDIRMTMTNTNAQVPMDEEAVDWQAEVSEAIAEKTKKPPQRGMFLTTGDTKERAEAFNAIERGESEYDVLFTTYDQLNTVQGSETPRRRLMGRIAPKAFFALDEAHNAGGQGQGGWRVKGAPMPRSELVRDLVSRAGGVLYSSATYAKRPDVMDLYRRTDMSKAVENPTHLPALIQRGGVPLQQAVAEMLARSGQYLRRERSFEGIEYTPESIEVDRKTYEGFTTAVGEVYRFDRFISEHRKELANEIAAEEGGGGTRDSAVGDIAASSTEFSAIMHNLVNQMLLSIQADAVSDRAIEAYRRGEKPVIALSNTMESFLTDYMEGQGLSVGDPIELDFSTLLHRYLERTRRVTVKYPDGEIRHIMIPLDRFDSEAQAMYRRAEETIAGTDYSALPVSPIDHIRNRFARAGVDYNEQGIRVAEVTGRGVMIDYGQTPPTIAARPHRERGTPGKRVSIRLFQTGAGLDALLLNKSGSTGLSAHAQKAPKSDEKKRHMFVLQADANIDVFMQMLGRINRTGQVTLPRYTQMIPNIPAAVRPAAVLLKKMASLNANTTAQRGSIFSSDTVDFMNQYGDRVANDLLMDDPALDHALGGIASDGGAVDANGDPTLEGVMRKLTGRLVLVPIEKQEEVLDVISANYKALIEALDRAGENALEAKNIDLQAIVEASTEIRPHKGPSPFEQAATLDTVSIKSQGRALSPADILEDLKSRTKISGGDLPSSDPLQAIPAIAARTRRFWQERLANASVTFNKFRDDEVAAIKDPAAKDRAKGKLNGVFKDFQGLMALLYPGAQVRLSGATTSWPAIVLEVRRPGKAKNPAALGSWEATFAIPDGMRMITAPFSQLTIADETLGVADGLSVGPAEPGDTLKRTFEAFEEARKEGRETRYIASGNLLSAYDAVKGKGQIINYTLADGSSRMGIIMPRSFSLNTFLESLSRPLPGPEAVREYLERAQEKAVKSYDGRVLIEGAGDGTYRITTPAARQTGGIYYTDDGVGAAIGGKGKFVKTGSKMVAKDLTATQIENAVRAMVALDASFATAGTGKDTALAKELEKKYTKVRAGSVDDGPDMTGWSVVTLQDNQWTGQRTIRIISPDGPRGMRSGFRGTDEEAILDAMGFPRPPPPRPPSTRAPRPRVEITDEPEYEAPRVDWRAIDNADRGTEASVMEAYGRGKGRVVTGYINVGLLPKPKGAGIKDGLPNRDARDGYSWDDFDRGRRSPPPAKIRLNRNGSITIMDGNHRIALWREQGHGSIPVFAIDERPEPDTAAAGQSSPIKLTATSRADIEREAAAIVQRMTGRYVPIKFFDRIPRGAIDPRQADLARAEGMTPAQSVGGYYEFTPALPGQSLIAIALNDPRYPDPLSTAVHEAGHDVFMWLLNDVEMTIYDEDLAEGDRSRVRRHAAAFYGVPVDHPKVRALDQFELFSVALENIRRMSEAGRMAEAEEGFHPALKRMWRRLLAILRAVRDMLRRRGVTTIDDVLEAAYRGDLGGRDPIEGANFGLRPDYAKPGRAGSVGVGNEVLFVANIHGVTVRGKGLVIEKGGKRFIQPDSGKKPFPIEHVGYLTTDTRRPDRLGEVPVGNVPWAPEQLNFFDDAPQAKYRAASMNNGGGYWRSRADRMFDPVRSWTDPIRRKLQDKDLAVRRLEEELQETTGVKLPVGLSTYTMMSLYNGRTGERLINLRRDHVEPLVEHMRLYGISREQGDRYLIARHAEERNEYIGRMYAPGDQLYDAMFDHDLVGGSGMSKNEADRILADAEAFDLAQVTRPGTNMPPGYEGFGALFDDLIEYGRSTLVKGGLISKETANEWRVRYQHYAPLRGFEGEDDPEGRIRGGRGFDVRGPEAMQAFGRLSTADSPLAYAVMQAEAAIVRSEKNRVLQTFLRYVRTHGTPDLAHTTKGEFRKHIDPRTGLVYESFLPAAFMGHKPDNWFGVKVAGKTTWLVVENELIARALRGTGTDYSNWFVRAMMGLSRFFAAMRTQWNPEFVVSNFMRDLDTALINVGSVEGRPAGTRRKIIKDALTLKAIRKIYRAIGDPAHNAEYSQFYEEYRMAGGKVSFLMWNDAAKIKRDLDKAFKRGKVGTALRGVAEWIDRVNTSVENGVRLSVYIALRQNNVSKDEAAAAARDLTVDFNRHGEWGPTINALFIFFNAAVQGSFRLLRGLVKSRAVQWGAIALMLLGATLRFYNSMVGGEYFQQIPEFVKERNFIIMSADEKGPTAGKYVMKPAAYGYNAFLVAGDQIMAAILGDVSPLEAAGNSASAALNAFNPLGEFSTPLQLITPSMIEPIAQIAENKTWWGGDLSRQKMPNERYKPDAHMGKPNTNVYAKDFAIWMNDVTGGDIGESGLVDMTPETAMLWWNHLVGGVGSLIGNSAATIDSIISADGEFDPAKAPFLRRVYGDATAPASQWVAFYDKYDLAAAAQYHMTALTKDGQLEEARRVWKEDRVDIEAYAVLEQIRKGLGAIRKQRDAVMDDDRMGSKEREKVLRDLAKQEDALFRQAQKVETSQSR